MSENRRFILAHSSEGAALCFLTFCREGFHELGQHASGRDAGLRSHGSSDAGVVGGGPMKRSVRPWRNRSSADGGYDFFACPDNTAHIALGLAGPDLPCTGLDIADVVAERGEGLGMKRVAVLGTRFTMAGPVYRRALPAVGIEPVLPDDEERRGYRPHHLRTRRRPVHASVASALHVEIIQRLKTEEGCDGSRPFARKSRCSSRLTYRR